MIVFLVVGNSSIINHPSSNSGGVQSMTISIPFGFFFSNYNRKYYQLKYTIDYYNLHDPHDDEMDGIKNGTEYDQDDISDHICYQIFFF